uniref:Uncharacterized protein n=1 Tax=Sphaerodactylus townsendi TaxID=933632 RepID=A0ACB8EQN3_9SAUR
MQSCNIQKPSCFHCKGSNGTVILYNVLCMKIVQLDCTGKKMSIDSTILSFHILKINTRILFSIWNLLKFAYSLTAVVSVLGSGSYGLVLYEIQCSCVCPYLRFCSTAANGKEAGFYLKSRKIITRSTWFFPIASRQLQPELMVGKSFQQHL